MKTTIQHFFLGLAIAFSLSIILMASVTSLTTIGAEVLFPVRLVWQALALSIICSLINLVYRSEKLSFVWQSILGYILTTSAIVSCSLIFNWLDFDISNVNKTFYIILFFIICSFCYLITWIIIWRINRRKEKELNDKLKIYTQQH